MFSPPVYLNIGDEYDKRDSSKTFSRREGQKQFTVSAKKHPHLLDSTFTNFSSVSTGDPYKAESIHGPFRQRDSTKDRSTVPFRPTGPSHSSGKGKGTYYGTFCDGNPHKHETEFPPIYKEKGDVGRNFYTNPSKKGTYGYSGLTIAKAGEVIYVSDPYEGNKRKEALQRKEDIAQEVGVPFKSSVRHGGCFDDSDRGFTTVYSLSKPLPHKKEKPKEVPFVSTKPWVPGNALTKEITKYPEYKEDPYDIRERRIREQKQAERDYKAWCPAGNDPWRYIYHKPIQFDPACVE